VLIKACMNGGRTRDEHPSVPQTSAELAAEAAAAVRAGAGAVHLHPRDPSGAETLDAEAVLAAVAVAANIEAALDGHGLAAPRLHHGYGPATWPVLRAAIGLGRDIRVGLEDTTVLADGRVASGNAELVEAAVRLVAELSRPS